MTKREAKQRKLEWNHAIAEGRVVRIDMGGFRSFPTAECAQAYLAEVKASGLALNVSIVDPSLAQSA